MTTFKQFEQLHKLHAAFDDFDRDALALAYRNPTDAAEICMANIADRGEANYDRLREFLELAAECGVEHTDLLEAGLARYEHAGDDLAAAAAALNGTESHVFTAMKLNAEGCSGGDFGIMEELHVPGLSRKALGGYVTQLQQKGLVTVYEPHYVDSSYRSRGRKVTQFTIEAK